MNNRKLSVEDINNSIEIFGLEFNLEFSEEYIKKIKRIKVDEIEKDNNVFNQLKEILNIILDDEKAYNKIYNEYKKQVGKELGIQGFLKVFEFIFEEYQLELKKLQNNKINQTERPYYKKNNYYKNNFKYRR